MKKVALIRKVDALGRITIPSEMRRTLGIAKTGNVFLQIEAVSDGILLKRYDDIQQHCIVCETEERLHEVDGFLMCTTCITKHFNEFSEEK